MDKSIGSLGAKRAARAATEHMTRGLSALDKTLLMEETVTRAQRTIMPRVEVQELTFEQAEAICPGAFKPRAC